MVVLKDPQKSHFLLLKKNHQFPIFHQGKIILIQYFIMKYIKQPLS